jgi:mannose-6-phosphate isomerase-like protein (cupin superfamily)
MTASRTYDVVDFAGVDPVRCPCGWARRAFGEASDGVASMHVVEIEADSETHYHKRTTEFYYVLEGTGHLELDGEEIPLRPGVAAMIRPGCRHRAVGKLRILNIPVPAFDPEDEYLVE